MAFYTFSKDVIPGSLAVLWDDEVKKIIPFPVVITVDEDSDDNTKDIVNLRSGDFVVRIMASDVEDAKEAQDVIDEIATVMSAGTYKKYVALMTQASSSAPVATVLDNGIGTIIWARTSAGNYTGTLNGAFPSGKVVILHQSASGVTMGRIGVNSIFIAAGADSAFTAMGIEVRVYN